MDNQNQQQQQLDEIQKRCQNMEHDLDEGIQGTKDSAWDECTFNIIFVTVCAILLAFHVHTIADKIGIGIIWIVLCWFFITINKISGF